MAILYIIENISKSKQMIEIRFNIAGGQKTNERKS